jgi:RHS repeat-associated protein
MVDGSVTGGGIPNGVAYDQAGRVTQMRFPMGGNLWRTYTYAPFNQQDSQGGRLTTIQLGTSPTGIEQMWLRYLYDSFGNVKTWYENYDGGVNTSTWNYTYDAHNRLTNGFGQNYAYDTAGRLTGYEGTSYGYLAAPAHAVNTVGGLDRYDYDANGNVTVRHKGLSTQQTLTWSHENRLASLTATGLSESYLYDDTGIRVKKVSGSTTTYYPFPHYEVSGSAVTKYYFFNGQRVAMRQSGVLYYLHPEHLGGNLFATDASGTTKSSVQGYYAYGKTRWGNLQTDHRFTGQKYDATGLYYFNARYYDPAIGTFISPDTLVPDPANVWDYNRFMYARGNPMKYNDPTGHCASYSSIGEEPKPKPGNGDCWGLVDHILGLWERDQSGYWQQRWVSQDIFRKHVAATLSNDSAFMLQEINRYWNSDTYQQWKAQQPQRPNTPPAPVDTGDYWAATLGLGLGELSLIRDDFGTWYVRTGLGPNFPGPNLSRGDVVINMDPQQRPFGNLQDIDSLVLDAADKQALMTDAITGHSMTASATFFVGVGFSSGLHPPYHGSVEVVLGPPGASVTNWSYTFVIWD